MLNDNAMPSKSYVSSQIDLLVLCLFFVGLRLEWGRREAPLLTILGMGAIQGRRFDGHCPAIRLPSVERSVHSDFWGEFMI